MRVAEAVNLPAAKVETRTVEGIEYLLVERFDRTHRKSGETIILDRLHQEDFCQAQNIVPETKYQKEGRPSLKRCFQLLREASSAPVIDLARLLDAVIFNYLVGNNDAHGKNFSLLYYGVGTANQEIWLAPLYDIVSTTYYSELSKEMAMKIGDEYSSDHVRPRDFEKLAEEAGLTKPIVRKRVTELAEAILAVIGATKLQITHPVTEAVAALIRNRCESARPFPKLIRLHLMAKPLGACAGISFGMSRMTSALLRLSKLPARAQEAEFVLL